MCYSLQINWQFFRNSSCELLQNEHNLRQLQDPKKCDIIALWCNSGSRERTFFIHELHLMPFPNMKRQPYNTKRQPSKSIRLVFLNHCTGVYYPGSGSDERTFRTQERTPVSWPPSQMAFPMSTILLRYDKNSRINRRCIELIEVHNKRQALEHTS